MILATAKSNLHNANRHFLTWYLNDSRYRRRSINDETILTCNFCGERLAYQYPASQHTNIHGFDHGFTKDELNLLADIWSS